MIVPDHVRALQSVAEAFMRYDVDEALHPDLGPELNFETLRPQLEEIKAAVRDLLAFDLVGVPQFVAQQGQSAIGLVEGKLNELKGYQPKALRDARRDVFQVREQLLNDARNVLLSFFTAFAPTLAWANATDRGQLANADIVQRRELLEQLRTAVAEAAKMRDEVASIAAESRDKAREAGISDEAVHFAREATAHAEAATRWLWAVCGAAGITAGLAVWNLVRATAVREPSIASGGEHLIIAKLLVFSVLVSATVWCGKIYRAHKHNEVVNRHRQNALSSFRTFAASAGDPETKNAILVQATTSIFAPQYSGYGATETEPSVTTPLIEIMRTLPSGK